MRALLQPHFSPKRMRALRPRVEQLTAALLDELADHRPPTDLHEALALPLPIAVISELLGVPTPRVTSPARSSSWCSSSHFRDAAALTVPSAVALARTGPSDPP